ncbi:MAG: T9SS type A sorting domain-containing protein [Bacteroidales bacterium]|nr:T9SS type A sorting domain-containing protein [Bacteroidales bacterium]
MKTTIIFLSLLFFILELELFAQDNAISFDGTDDYIEINTPDLGIGDLDELTVMAWVRWDVNPGTGNQWANIASSQSNTTRDFGQFWLQHNSDNSKFEYAVQTATGRAYVQSLTTTVQGQWYHVAGVYDGSHVKIFINGVEEAQTSRSGAIRAYDGSFRAMIAQWAHNSETYRRLAGTLDDVAIYSKALTSTEIIQRMNNPDLIEDTETDLVGAWKFDEVSGSTVQDENDTDNDGTLYGAVTRDETSAPKDPDGSTLPIELGSFAATQTEDGILLKWITLAEINNSYFTLFSSNDGKNYSEIGRVEGANNSNTPLSYQFLDRNPKSEMMFYKLQQTDYDGKSQIFLPITIQLEKSSNIQVYPIPSIANQPITIDFAKSVSAIVEIYDQTGKLLISNEVLDSQMEFSLQQSGIYFLKIFNNGEISTRKIVIE